MLTANLKKQSSKKNTGKSYLLSKFQSLLPEFKGQHVTDYNPKTFNNKGAFGEISLCKIPHMGVICAEKVLSGSMNDLKAEALEMHQVSGNPCFPFLYSLLKPGAILMEYISSMGIFPSRIFPSIDGKQT